MAFSKPRSLQISAATRLGVPTWGILVLALLPACSGEEGGPLLPGGTGGAAPAASGGTSGSGGSTGGSSSGIAGNGGAPAATGGVPNSSQGGSSASGGSGKSSGGAPATGGVTNTGGASTTGGATASGGSTGGSGKASGGSTGGSGKASGGSSSQAGSTGTGGKSASGGNSATGGASGSGGNSATGGASGSGGNSATGGSGGAVTSGECAKYATGATGKEPGGQIPLCCAPSSAEKPSIDEVFRLLNEHRAANGLSALAYDSELELAIQGHCAHMAQHTFFDHTAPEASVASPWARAEACGSKANGENIAKGQQNPAAVMTAWKDSSGHNQNMLGNFKRVGIGFEDTGRHWGQIFGN